MTQKSRLDVLLVNRKLAESRSQAQRLVMAGQVRVNGQVVGKPAARVDESAALTVDRGPRFVSRGGAKLQAAFDAFNLDVSGLICADVGASTGGFTDCLLQHGAAKVYTLDVGKGILHWNLRKDARVVVMESTNARYVEALPEPVAFVSIDASFISLKILLPVIKNWFSADEKTTQKNIVALIKPQFEAGRKDVARGKGVVRDPEIHWRVLRDVLGFAQEAGYHLQGVVRSPVLGPKGNVEFLGWLALGEREKPQISVEELVAQVLPPAP